MNQIGGADCAGVLRDWQLWSLRRMAGFGWQDGLFNRGVRGLGFCLPLRRPLPRHWFSSRRAGKGDQPLPARESDDSTMRVILSSVRVG